jgi:DNA repair exonuclease SbcCD ATPase subunit
MAVVNVELSEYDALRESLKDYKERVAKLDNELSGLKKGENVVVTTKYCVRKVENIKKLIENSINAIKDYYSSPFYGRTGYSEILTNPKIIQCLTQAIYNAFAHDNSFYGIGDFEVKQSSTEVQGYNDLRLVIENKLKEEAKAEIESLKQSYIDSKEKYEKKYSELKDEFEEKFKKESNKVKEEYKDQFEEFERTIENKEKTIIDLQTKLSDKSERLGKAEKELSDNVQYKNGYFDLKEQNELLNEKIETLTKELEKAKKPSLLNKVFNW